MIFHFSLVIIAGHLKKCLNIFRPWRVVRAGRRSTVGNRVNGYSRFEGSNPLLSAKKQWVFFLYLLFSFCCFQQRKGFDPPRRSRTQSRICEANLGRSPNPLLSAKKPPKTAILKGFRRFSIFRFPLFLLFFLSGIFRFFTKKSKKRPHKRPHFLTRIFKGKKTPVPQLRGTGKYLLFQKHFRDGAKMICRLLFVTNCKNKRPRINPRFFLCLLL